jgi:hypothetical protein
MGKDEEERASHLLHPSASTGRLARRWRQQGDRQAVTAAGGKKEGMERSRDAVMA